MRRLRVLLIGGVLCLAAPVAARFGFGTLRSLFMFVVSVVVGTTLAAVLLFGLVARVLARVRPLQFGRIISPGVAVAFTTASSRGSRPIRCNPKICFVNR